MQVFQKSVGGLLLVFQTKREAILPYAFLQNFLVMYYGHPASRKLQVSWLFEQLLIWRWREGQLFVQYACATPPSPRPLMMGAHTHTYSFQDVLLLMHVSPQNSAAGKSCMSALRYCLINGLVDKWIDGPVVGFVCPRCLLLDHTQCR